MGGNTSFERTNRSLAKLTIAALFFAVLFSSETQAMGDIDSFAELESCVANASETECTITGDFEYTGNLAISHDLTIKGNATLSRAASYTGTLFSIADGASLNLEDLTLDGGDMAFYINNIPGIEVDGLTIKNSHHESRPDYYVSGIFGGDTATLSNINYFNNAGQMQFGDLKDLKLTDSYFCSSEEYALRIGAITGETNATISNTAVCRDTTGGPAMIVQNYDDDGSVSSNINLTLGNGFKIVGNTNSGIPDDPDSLYGGYGGGLYVEAHDDINLTVSEGANISSNSASIAGNDIFMRNVNDAATITATILGDYLEDNIDKRAADFGIPALEQYTLRGGENLGLAHAALPDEGGDSDSGDASNPDTNDHLAINAAIFAIVSLCGIVIIHKRR